MKKFFLVLSAVILLALGACQKAPELAVTGPTSIDMSADGSSGSITFMANRDWTVSCSESWVHVSPTSGAASDGSVTVSVKCDANTTYNDRTATVTIKAEDLTQSVTVKQPQNLGVIVPTQTYEVGVSGGTLEIAVQANVEFEVNLNADWIHYTQTKALDNRTVALTVDKNSGEDRNAEVKISQNGGSLNVTVTVSQEGELVDLGLSVKWRKYNLGATKPEDYGDYYAWGETEPKDKYSWSMYKWANGAEDKLTKYCPTDKPAYWDGAGDPDGKAVLDPEDDVAHVKLGGKWRMPTDAEWTELRTKCTWTLVTNYNGSGINGRLVKATNGNSIFLPAAGDWGKHLYDAGSGGYYRSSSLNTGDPDFAWGVYFYSDDVGRRYYYSRFLGLPVRPVSE